jgi:5'-nucleotidase
MFRRDFLQKSLLGIASLSLLGPSLLAEAASSTSKLTILHTNDMHSRIELGGMARREALIASIRKQEPNVLLLDSGDIWQGTPYFNFFQGELEYKLMSRMKYDASTFGNHDFDNGLEGLQKQLPNAGFPFLSANYDFSGTPLAGRFQPYKVFEKAGARIGVFGVGIELKGLVADKNFGATKYLDPVATAKAQVQQLRQNEHCDMVICLSHLGYKYESEKLDDRKLAAHTFMPAPEPIMGPNGHVTLINQVGWSGINLGRIDYELQRGARPMRATSALVLPVGATC